MIRRRFGIAGLALVTLAAAAPRAGASLIGTTVFGDLYSNGGTTNLFSPPSLIIDGSSAFTSPGNTPFSALFTGNSLEITLENFLQQSVSLPSQEFVFTDNAFYGLGFAAQFDNFSGGGLTGGLGFDTITLNWAGGPIGPGQTYTADFSVAPGATLPEPSPLWLLTIGAAGSVAYARRRPGRGPSSGA